MLTPRSTLFPFGSDGRETTPSPKYSWGWAPQSHPKRRTTRNLEIEPSYSFTMPKDSCSPLTLSSRRTSSNHHSIINVLLRNHIWRNGRSHIWDTLENTKNYNIIWRMTTSSAKETSKSYTSLHKSFTCIWVLMASTNVFQEKLDRSKLSSEMIPTEIRISTYWWIISEDRRNSPWPSNIPMSHRLWLSTLVKPPQSRNFMIQLPPPLKVLENTLMVSGADTWPHSQRDSTSDLKYNK